MKTEELESYVGKLEKKIRDEFPPLRVTFGMEGDKPCIRIGLVSIVIMGLEDNTLDDMNLLDVTHVIIKGLDYLLTKVIGQDADKVGGIYHRMKDMYDKTKGAKK